MKSIFTVLLFALTLNLSFGQITVTGTGCNPFGIESVDGTYNISTMQFGKNSYLSTGPTSDYHIEWTGSIWILEFGNSSILFTNSTDVGLNPPATGWSVGINFCGGSPAPTLSGDVGTLPVELTFFDAKVINKEVLLSWQTASELNNEKFEIEVSEDGREFKKIAEVKGNETTLEQQDYSFEVKNPQNGISYYRLKQVDFDGQFEYSEVLSLNFKREIGEIGQFYPSPSKSGLVNLDYTTQTDEEITITVFDMTGKLVFNEIQQVLNGDNNLSFDFSNLNTGIYIVKIGNTKNSTHRKIIIEK
jgi:hypothetical protein